MEDMFLIPSPNVLPASSKGTRSKLGSRTFCNVHRIRLNRDQIVTNFGKTLQKNFANLQNIWTLLPQNLDVLAITKTHLMCIGIQSKPDISILLAFSSISFDLYYLTANKLDLKSGRFLSLLLDLRMCK